SSGLGSITSVRRTVPMPAAGRSNMFGGMSSGSNWAAASAGLGVMVGTAAAIAPLLVAALVVDVRSPWQVVIGIAGVAADTIGWRAGVRAGARTATGREPELLATLSTLRS